MASRGVPDKISRGVPETFYDQLAAILRKRIAAGEWTDRPLPSIRELMQEYEVGRDTVMRAIKILNDDGLVTTVDKRGTYVNRT